MRGWGLECGVSSVWVPAFCVSQYQVSGLQRLQGYLAHKKQRFPRTLQWDFVEGLMVYSIVVGLWTFFSSSLLSSLDVSDLADYKSTSRIRNRPPPLEPP